jgi:putative phosphoribosyl transferase
MAIEAVKNVRVRAGTVVLDGWLAVPPGATTIVALAHASGVRDEQGRCQSTRSRTVAKRLNEAGIATLELDLLTVPEEIRDLLTGELRSDTDLLAERLVGVVQTIGRSPKTRDMRIGLLGWGMVAPAVLLAASQMPQAVALAVAIGGSPAKVAFTRETVQVPALRLPTSDDIGDVALRVRDWVLRTLHPRRMAPSPISEGRF